MNIDSIITISIAIGLSGSIIWILFNPRKAKEWAFGLFKLF
jgi:hypothetical protein